MLKKGLRINDTGSLNRLSKHQV